MSDADVKVTLKPSQEVIEKAVEEWTVNDSKGRVIRIKKPGVLAQFRLVEALGDTAKNESYMNMVLPIIYVIAIDDQAVFPPSNKMQVEALIQRLDEAGIVAVTKFIQDTFGQIDPEKDAESLKK